MLTSVPGHIHASADTADRSWRAARSRWSRSPGTRETNADVSVQTFPTRKTYGYSDPILPRPGILPGHPASPSEMICRDDAHHVAYKSAWPATVIKLYRCRIGILVPGYAVLYTYVCMYICTHGHVHTSCCCWRTHSSRCLDGVGLDHREAIPSAMISASPPIRGPSGPQTAPEPDDQIVQEPLQRVIYRTMRKGVRGT